MSFKEVVFSAIIPCYNHGAYIEEAIASIKENAGSASYEIIVIDDGSTDPHTVSVLDGLSDDEYIIIRQKNQGLAAARNNGISLATGKYIIPLDSDNKLHKNYLTKALDILDANAAIDVVYGNPIFFGEDAGEKKIGAYDFFKMIKSNYIDACAVFRRSLWERVAGYDGAMPAMGNEDWEFWIHSFLVGANFFYLDDVCFYYRVLPNSMSVEVTRPGFALNQAYIYHKHSSAIINKLLEKIGALDYSVSYTKNNRLKSIIKIIAGVNL